MALRRFFPFSLSKGPVASVIVWFLKSAVAKKFGQRTVSYANYERLRIFPTAVS